MSLFIVSVVAPSETGSSSGSSGLIKSLKIDQGRGHTCGGYRRRCTWIQTDNRLNRQRGRETDKQTYMHDDRLQLVSLY